jgi:hypothetical protein
VPFAPSDISGLQLWFKADGTLWQTSARLLAATADGDSVGAWDDASANANHALQATLGKRPTLKTNIVGGKPVVRFAGSVNINPGTHNTDTVWSIFAVASKSGGTGYQSVFTGNDASLYARLTADVWGTYENTDISSGTAMGTTSAIEMIVKRAANDIDLANNGGPLVNRTTGSGVQNRPAPTTIGNEQAGLQQFAGDIAELIVYNVPVTKAQMDQLGGYLGTKYGITWTNIVPFMPRGFPISTVALRRAATI